MFVLFLVQRSEGVKLNNMPTTQKEEIISEITELMKNSDGILLTDYRGLTVSQVSDLRKKLRESDATFAIVKNTLFKRAGAGLLPEAGRPAAGRRAGCRRTA